MELRELGGTGLRVSAVGFGASPLGNVFGDVPRDTARAAVRRALDLGINFFDTSPYKNPSPPFLSPPISPRPPTDADPTAHPRSGTTAARSRSQSSAIASATRPFRGTESSSPPSAAATKTRVSTSPPTV